MYELPIQANGRVILPSELRLALGLQKGDRVIIEAEGDQITLTTAPLRHKRAQAIAKRYAKPGVSVVEEFLALGLHIHALDIDLTVSAGGMFAVAKPFGLSHGDRACLAWA